MLAVVGEDLTVKNIAVVVAIGTNRGGAPKMWGEIGENVHFLLIP
jgi:hypothetical protein